MPRWAEAWCGLWGQGGGWSTAARDGVEGGVVIPGAEVGEGGSCQITKDSVSKPHPIGCGERQRSLSRKFCEELWFLRTWLGILPFSQSCG